MVGGGLVTIHANVLIAEGALHGAISLLASLVALVVGVVYGYYAYLLGVFSYRTSQQSEKFRLGKGTDSLLRSLRTLRRMCNDTIDKLSAAEPDGHPVKVPEADIVALRMHVYSIKSEMISARVEHGAKTRPLDTLDRIISDLQKGHLDITDIRRIRRFAMEISSHVAKNSRKSGHQAPHPRTPRQS